MTGDALLMRWRTGRKLGRTVYAQAGTEPADDDVLLGLMDTPALARETCEAHNKVLEGRY